MKESQIEKKMRMEIEASGGRFYKFLSSVVGVPDRILIYRGRVIFVETKAAAGRSRKIQLYRQREMRDAGADVREVSGWDAAQRFLSEVLTK